MSVLWHREDPLGGHQKEVSVVQLHVEGNVSAGRVLEATGIPQLRQAAIKLEKNKTERNDSQMKDEDLVALWALAFNIQFPLQ